MSNNKKQEQGTTVLEIQALVQKNDQEWGILPTLTELIDTRCQDLTCHQYTATVGQSQAKLYAKSNRLIVAQPTIHRKV